MKRLFGLLALLLTCVETFAFPVSGKVVSAEDGNAIEGAYVSVLSGESSVAQGISDKDGKFTISINKAGDYTLRIQAVGYVVSQVVLTNLHEKLEMGDIALQVDVQMLDEVVVQAENYTRVDRQIIFPSKAAVENSFNSMEMLSKLMLPGLIVNTANNTIVDLERASVQVRINDIVATMDDVLALTPQRVLKVEYIDMPSVRYGDAGKVINIITRQVEDGYSVSGSVSAAINALYTNDYISLKYNQKQSEFGLNYRYTFSNFSDVYTDEHMQLNLPEQTLILDKQGIPSHQKSLSHNLSFSYNWRNDAGTIFNAVLRNTLSFPRQTARNQIIDQLNSRNYASELQTQDRSYSPTLELYFLHPITAKQTLIANAIGTYTTTDYRRSYWEQSLQGEQLYSFGYDTDGKRYTGKGELIYENKFHQAFSLSAGVNYSYSYAKNIYKQADGNTVNALHQDELYAYVQLQGSLGKFSYIAGVGLSREGFREDATDYTHYLFHPQLNLSWAPVRNLSFRLSSDMRPSIPSLTRLSEFKQWANPYELNIGNPNLKPMQVYVTSGNVTYRIKRLTAQVGFYHQYNRKSVENTITLEQQEDGQYYVQYMPENQKYHQHIQGQFFLTWEAFKDHLNLTAYGVLNRYLDKGNNYHNTYTGTMYGFQAEGNWNGWSLSSSYASGGAMGIAYGKHYYPGPTIQIGLRKRIKQWQVGVDVYNLFKPHGETGGQLRDATYVYKRTHSYTSDMGNQVRVSVSWNFDGGRKYRSTTKRTTIYEDTSSGIVK